VSVEYIVSLVSVAKDSAPPTLPSQIGLGQCLLTASQLSSFFNSKSAYSSQHPPYDESGPDKVASSRYFDWYILRYVRMFCVSPFDERAWQNAGFCDPPVPTITIS
jgi:hypothetical protein